MGLHLKSTKSFKILIGFSALLISVMAATFSITGIATLFSGYFLTVALMMGALELAKIIVASFLARYWNAVSRILRGYFIAALFVLILITSGGIFGYLSDAYQQTKGDYTIIENQTTILKNKRNRFDLNTKNYRAEKERTDANINVTLQALRDNKITYRDTSGTLITTQSATARRLYEKQLNENQKRREDLTIKIDALSDSATAMDMKIFELESKNIQGELGPLKYIAGIFNTDMDTVVKYFIFFLIFVFDPLAVLLFVALNMIIRKERGMYAEDDDDGLKKDIEYVQDKLKKSLKITDAIPEEIVKTMDVAVENLKAGKVSEPIDIEKEILEELHKDDEDDKNVTMLDKLKLEQKDDSESFVNELIEDFEHNDITEPQDEIKEETKEDEEKKEHEFYHDDVKTHVKITKKSSNYHPPK